MANHFIRSGLTYNGDGTTWASAAGAGATGAFNDMPTSWTRGDTYYVAGGTYSSRQYNTAVSGTILITIKGATAGDHGTETGWDISYSVVVSAAHFSNASNGAQTCNAQFGDTATGYWLFDGNTGTPGIPSSFGFVFDASATATDNGVFVGSSNNPNHITVKHVYAQASGGDGQKQFFNGAGYSTESDLCVSYCHLDGWQNSFSAMGTGNICEHNWIINGFSSGAHHGEDINCGNTDGLIIRFNVFKDRVTGTGVIPANNGALLNTKIYGNLFIRMMTGGGGNGLICDEGGAGQTMTNVLAYNNTFVSCVGAWWGNQQATSGCVAYNNLFYNMGGAVTDANLTHDYNSFFSCSTDDSGANKQVSASDPFVNLGGDDYHLSFDSSAWTALGTPYDVDIDGVARISSRGAYQYVSGDGEKKVMVVL